MGGEICVHDRSKPGIPVSLNVSQDLCGPVRPVGVQTYLAAAHLVLPPPSTAGGTSDFSMQCPRMLLFWFKKMFRERTVRLLQRTFPFKKKPQAAVKAGDLHISSRWSLHQLRESANGKVLQCKGVRQGLPSPWQIAPVTAWWHLLKGTVRDINFGRQQALLQTESHSDLSTKAAKAASDPVRPHTKQVCLQLKAHALSSPQRLNESNHLIKTED